MFRIVQNISMPNINSAMANGRRMAFPVDPAFLIYSNFEHVYGTSPQNGAQGVSISKLRLLDTLIRQLSQLRNEAAPPVLALPGEDAGNHIDNAQVDALIESYRSQIQQSIVASETLREVMPYIPSPNVQNGVAFNLVT